MTVADAGHDRRNVPVFAIKREAALGIVPAEGGEAPFDGRDGAGLVAPRSRANGTAGSAGCDVEPDGLRVWWERSQIGPPTPGRKMLPVRGVSLAGIGGAGGFDIAPCSISELARCVGV